MRSDIVINKLKSVKIVFVNGITPDIFSIGLPGVAANKGIDPESPPCQVKKPM
jgi:hypothetical protein